MNEKELKHIVDCNTEKMIKELGLGAWQIEFKYGIPDNCDDDTTVGGRCKANIEAKRATIILNPQVLTTKKRAISTLRHELVHLIMKPFEKYRRATYKLFEATTFPTTDRAFVILNEVYRSAIEEVTYDICRILEKR